MLYQYTPVFSGSESAILNRDSGDSELSGSNGAIRRSRLNTDRPRFGLAILNRFSAILFYCDSTHFCASHCGISGKSDKMTYIILRFGN